MHQTTVDGVATLWDDLPGHFTAALVVGMGAADETFTTSGITHLIEHLVMAQIGRRPVSYNANVDIDSCAFVASGDRADVLQFIEDVACQLSNPDTSRIAHEAKVIQIEGGIYGPPPLAEALRARCGFRGAGLTFAPEPDLAAVTPQAITELTGRLVRKEGCVLVLTGAPAADVRIPVPDGRPDRSGDAPFLSRTTPGAVRGYSSDQVTISFLTPEPSEALGVLLTDRAFETLRMRDGLSYQFDAHATTFNGQGLTALGADFAENRAPDVARALRREVQRLATAPPSEAEIDHVRSQLSHRCGDPTEAFPRMIDEAIRVLRGLPARPHPAVLEMEMALMADEELHRAATMAQDTLLVHLPLEVWDETDDADRFDDLPFDECSVVSHDEFPTDGVVFARRISLPTRRRSAVVLTDKAIVLRHGRHLKHLEWSQIVGVGRFEDTRTMVTIDGATVEIRSRDFQRGQDLLSRLDARTADRQFAADSCGFYFDLG